MRRAREAKLAALALGSLTFLWACGSDRPPGPPAAATPAPTPEPTPRPSFILVLADDLDMPSMPELDSLASVFSRDGAIFSQAYATHPLCSPSRASLLTGMYTHNHGVLDNVPPAGGYPVFRRHEPNTIATLLQEAGYRTALIGKYLNSYPEGLPAAEAIPPGWDRWYAHITSFGGERYLNYWVNDQGIQGYRGSNLEDYSTDVQAEKAEEFLDEVAQGDSPFFLFVSVEAPHIHPVIAAERHAVAFTSARAPRLPSFNEEDVSDKPAFVQNSPLLDASQIRRLDILQRGRLRTMLAVDDLIRRLLTKLETIGHSERTYLIFTSDNGFCMGVHRQFARKRNFYEESIHVPLMVRGPGVVQGRTLDALVELIDIPATLADLAGLSAPETHDGRSLRSLLEEGATPAGWREDVLVEFYPAHMSSALRTPEYLYTELSALEEELYDMRSDPYQLDNLIRVADPELLERLSARLAQRRTCRGETCRR